MGALGDKPAAKITTVDVEALLRAVADSGVTPRTANRVRAMISAIFNYGRRPRAAAQSCRASDRRRKPHRAPLVDFDPEEVEALARGLEDGLHRDARRDRPDRTEAERAEDHQDAEAVWLAAYTGLRLGELLALRWGDVDWSAGALKITRALSAGIEGPPKLGRDRRVPLADQAAAALERLSHRENFTTPDDLVW